ncbi:MAG: hypothetical protein LCH85_22050 [Chloroflexi bacterium]|nr:hypothetical protein [Chloroflexota bacterium]
MPERLIDEVSNVNRSDGFWTSPDTYVMQTPCGYAIAFYADGHLSLRLIYEGRRHLQNHRGVKTKKHAVTLLRRFYYEVIDG